MIFMEIMTNFYFAGVIFSYLVAFILPRITAIKNKKNINFDEDNHTPANTLLLFFIIWLLTLMLGFFGTLQLVIISALVFAITGILMVVMPISSKRVRRVVPIYYAEEGQKEKLVELSIIYPELSFNYAVAGNPIRIYINTRDLDKLIELKEVVLANVKFIDLDSKYISFKYYFFILIMGISCIHLIYSFILSIL